MVKLNEGIVRGLSSIILLSIVLGTLRRLFTQTERKMAKKELMTRRRKKKNGKKKSKRRRRR